MNRLGLQPVYLDVYKKGAADRFSAIWYGQPPFNTHSAAHGIPGANFQTAFDQQLTNGLGSRCIVGYQNGPEVYFAGIWTQ